ncbi:hypothetical protein F0562_030707 [Nyssa sinensis]|uniref:Uncharacterized protein n=1 Tax=Nyssa sinensis TaxID=561372 RepID=A0A5J5AZ33_9ASTE|nr:hypothetical protein F0562_030707 [Nyssa sinensis]
MTQKCLRRYKVPAASTDRATESEPYVVERSQECGKRRLTFEEANSRITKHYNPIGLMILRHVVPSKSDELDSTIMSIPSTAEEVASLPSWSDDENIFENFDDQTFQSFLNDHLQF